ncbi:MAG: 16S rRNA (adenine(1518)-N(6)/adenine(1519)-N(6))-dimethyltransferase RsmA [Phycisphaerae bacterium]
MQTIREIRDILDSAGLSPQKRFGQCFLHDHHFMQALLDLAEVPPGATVLEVGPGTGSLTEELLERAAHVVAAEIDRGLSAALRLRLGGRADFTLVEGDALDSKHALSRRMLAALTSETHLVSNLPYNVATPLVTQCLVDTWRVHDGSANVDLRAFPRLTFTVQREVADRFAAAPETSDYGTVSVVASLLGKVTLGPVVPPTAFWPRPQVDSRIVRIDFRPDPAVENVDRLLTVVGLVMSQRRKKVSSAARRKGSPVARDAMSAALEQAGVNPDVRPDGVTPQQFAAIAAALGRTGTGMG